MLCDRVGCLLGWVGLFIGVGWFVYWGGLVCLLGWVGFFIGVGWVFCWGELGFLLGWVVLFVGDGRKLIVGGGFVGESE